MKQYLNAAIALIIISLTGFAYVIVRVLSYPEQAIICKSTFLWFLLQCSASLCCGILGGYFLGVHKRTQKADEAHDSQFQDSSVQE
jgi:hypothetical protein